MLTSERVAGVTLCCTVLPRLCDRHISATHACEADDFIMFTCSPSSAVHVCVFTKGRVSRV